MARRELATALALAEEKNLRFVSLQFTDIVGQVKSVQVPMHQLEEAVEHGKWFDGSSIEGFARIAESDMFLVPDLATFSPIPWEPGMDPDGRATETGSARVICDVFTPNGDPFPGDPRWVLRRQLQRRRAWAIPSTPVRSWSSSCCGSAMDRSSPCPMTPPATSTSAPTWRPMSVRR